MTGQDVHLLRLKLGLTQALMAEKLGVNQSTLSRWERDCLPLAKAWNRQVCKLRKRNDLPGMGSPVLDEDSLQKNWPDLIRFYRATRSLPREDLAEIMDCDFTTVYRWETGRCVPSLQEQSFLRDLILKPISSSKQFSCIRQRVAQSEVMIALGAGNILIEQSQAMRRVNERNDVRVPDYCRVSEMWGGKLETWMKVRWEAGFFSGNIAKTSAICRVARNDVRRIVSFPVPLDCGCILTMSYQIPEDPASTPARDGDFRILSIDEIVA